MRDDAYDEVMLPEEVERDDCRNDNCRELCRMNLVEEDFFPEGHRSIVAWGRGSESRW